MRVSRKKRTAPQDTKRYYSNDQIRFPRVRVIDEQGNNLGDMPTADAVRLAEERGLDLVIINPKEDPPIAKIVNYGKFKYQKEKERRKQRAQAKATEVKGIRLTPRMGDHDMDVRKKQALKFLERGDKVQIEIIMRGRDHAHPELMKDKMTAFVDAIKTDMSVKLEQPISRQGAKFIALIAR